MPTPLISSMMYYIAYNPYWNAPDHLARKIAEKSQVSVKAAKEAVNRAYETTMTEGILFERRNFQALFSTEDQKEGMAAFLEKREPQFRDR